MLSVKKQRVFAGPIATDVFVQRHQVGSSIPTVVLIPGFPDFPGPSALTTALVAEGCRVLQPHMPGTFDSSGRFGLAACAEAIRHVNRAITSASWSVHPEASPSSAAWRPHRLAYFGHSFGGLIALRTFHLLENLNLLAFTSAAVHYGDPYGCHEVGPKHYGEVASLYPNTYRLAPIDEWHGTLAGTDPVPDSPLGSVAAVRIVYGENDKYFDIPKATASVPGLIRRYVSADEETLTVVPTAGHPVAELLQVSNVRALFPDLFV